MRNRIEAIKIEQDQDRKLNLIVIIKNNRRKIAAKTKMIIKVNEIQDKLLNLTYTEL